MLEYTQAGGGARLPDAKIGTFPQISMKNDWNRIFPFQSTGSASRRKK